MRADEPMGIHERNKLSIRQDVDYINQLRYERLMAKARHFAELELDLEYLFKTANNPKYGNKCCSEVETQLTHIAEAYEARAKRIKEGM